jgi:hypothetical protein
MLFAKIDIEGGEYRMLPALMRDADKVCGMVIEFHDCDICGDTLESLMRTLLNDFAVVHLHGNNCAPAIAGTDIPRALEVTLINRLLLTDAERDSHTTRRYPLQGLDMPCDPSRRDPAVCFPRSA